ncbi:MAG TPA: IclR family transcriptional regulator [Alphaproteobacteria bacterium]|jgi:DNA-binding IclR family transcriptional regulator
MVKQKGSGETPATDRRRIKSVEVGFRTIRVLEAADAPLPLNKIAAAVSMPLSKAYVYLQSYVREGLVQQDPVTGFYGLGLFATQLGLAAIRKLDVVTVSRYDLDRLRDETRCATVLAVWGNHGPTIVLKADGEAQGPVEVRIGYVLSPTRSASGHVFLAALTEGDAEAAILAEVRARAGSIRYASVAAARTALKPLLTKVRRKGYAVSSHSGFAATAAPIFDYSGRIVAAMGILAPIGSPTAKEQPQIAELLMATTSRISAKLGYGAKSQDEPALKAALKG